MSKLMARGDPAYLLPKYQAPLFSLCLRAKEKKKILMSFSLVLIPYYQSARPADLTSYPVV